MLTTPEVHRWWGDAHLDDGWPGQDDSDAVRFVVLIDEQVIRLVQYYEEDDPDYRHAGIDISLYPRWHRHGYGADAVRTLARHLIANRGHHRLVIDPAADNKAAIHCYRKVGFRPVGVLRRHWRDPDGSWRTAC